MNPSRTPSLTALASAVSLFLLPAVQGFGQTTATTDPVGYASISCLANSDTLVSIPFARPTAYAGATSGAISGNVITFAGSPGFGASGSATGYKYVAGTQSNTYYALIGPNITTLASTVGVSNGSPTVTGTGLTVVAVGDELIVNGLAYNVASVATNGTSLTLSRNYTGTTNTAATAQYDHSPKEGSYYTVTDNGTNTLTVNLNGDSLTNVASGTTVSLIPYWTLGTAFPAANAYDATNNPTGSFVASTGTTNRTRGTTISTPDLTDAGFNLGTTASYIFLTVNNVSAWRILTVNGVDTTDSFNDTVLPPTTYFIVRNLGTQTTFTPSGGVFMNRITSPLDTQTSTAQDNAVAVPRPANVTLNDLGLTNSNGTSVPFVASTGTTNRTRGDTLFVYDNTQAGFNKGATASYVYLTLNGTSAWRALTVNGVDTSTDYGSTVIPYGTGFTIRKAATSAGTSFWQNTRNY